jgi:hypothetical protein
MNHAGSEPACRNPPRVYHSRMSDPSLLTAFDEIRGRTLRLIDVPQADALWTPAGTDNPILWHAGHIFVVVETLCADALDPTQKEAEGKGALAIPPGWFDAFGWNSTPDNDSRESWPPIAQIAAHLPEQHTRLRAALSQLTESRLSQPTESPARRRILHAFHDEALHGGEIKLLRKLLVHERAAKDRTDQKD